ncbi:MAG: hypothetical protein IH611_01605 [Deltaproteobacteria bacterium]|nr:hypothetical protein [Deltaproteobacteria bacterium]
MGVRDKELIEGRFGPLWSGRDEISVGGRTRTLTEVKRTFDLNADDIVSIDLHELPEGGFAFRFYDGDDRRIVVYVVDADGEIREEHRAHIAEWLGDSYYDSGALAFDPEAMVLFLRVKQQEADAR